MAPDCRTSAGTGVKHQPAVGEHEERWPEEAQLLLWQPSEMLLGPLSAGTVPPLLSPLPGSSMCPHPGQ